jgi:hypothetical protein
MLKTPTTRIFAIPAGITAASRRLGTAPLILTVFFVPTAGCVFDSPASTAFRHSIYSPTVPGTAANKTAETAENSLQNVQGHAEETTFRSQSDSLPGGWSGLTDEPSVLSPKITSRPADIREWRNRSVEPSGSHQQSPSQRIAETADADHDTADQSTSSKADQNGVSMPLVDSPKGRGTGSAPVRGIISSGQKSMAAENSGAYTFPAPAVRLRRPVVSTLSDDRSPTTASPGQSEGAASISGDTSPEILSDRSRDQREVTDAEPVRGSSSVITSPVAFESSVDAVSDPDQAVDESQSRQPEQSRQPTRTPTMLNRLRDLYSPRTEEKVEEKAEENPKKSFRRIPGPWDLLREKPASEPPDPARTVDAAATDRPSSEDTAPRNEAENESVESEAAVSDLADSETTDSLDKRIAALTGVLEAELKSWPRDDSGQVANSELWRRRQSDLRLLYLIANRSGDAVSAIESLPANEQELWQAMIMAMDHYRGHLPTGLEPALESGAEIDSDTAPAAREKEMRVVAEQLRSAVRYAQELAPLTIRRISFCSSVDGFGIIDEIPTSSFTAGQPALIYAEIDNFRSETAGDGTYRTQFSATLEIRRVDEDGSQLIEAIPVPEISDSTTTRRTDYFQSFELTIPSHLTEGRYEIRIILMDLLSRQHAESILPFIVRSPDSEPAGRPGTGWIPGLTVLSR